MNKLSVDSSKHLKFLFVGGGHLKRIIQRGEGNSRVSLDASSVVEMKCLFGGGGSSEEDHSEGSFRRWSFRKREG